MRETLKETRECRGGGGQEGKGGGEIKNTDGWSETGNRIKENGRG